jgi:RNA polymerase sigma-70 factor, ECF subfamily
MTIDRKPDAATDEALVQAARAGDHDAYGQLYERYARMVHGVLLSRVAFDVVDDLVQDVFLKAMTELHNLRDGAHFGGWIAAIARNRAADNYRRTRETQDSDGVAETVLIPENSSSRLDAHVVLAALQSLPAAYRETLAMRLIDGMAGPEIAARTGLSHGSVRVNLHRGFKLLRERLQPQGAAHSAQPQPKEGGAHE